MWVRDLLDCKHRENHRGCAAFSIHDSGDAQSLQILACASHPLMRRMEDDGRRSSDIVNSYNFLYESVIILFLQTLHGLHGLVDCPRLSSCPSLVRSDPKGKKHQSFSSVAEVLMLSKYWFILSWPMASSTSSLWRSESGAQAPFPVMTKMFPGDIVLEQTVLSHCSKSIHNHVPCPVMV